MKWVSISRYTSWDNDVVQALWQFWFWYLLDWLETTTVTTLNRIKTFVEKYIWIQEPTRKLIESLLERTEAWHYIWEGIDNTMNMCQMFVVHVKKFKDWVQSLLEQWILKKEKTSTHT